MAMLRVFAIAAILCVSEGLHSVKKTTSEDLKTDATFALDANASPPMFTKETMPKVSPTLQCVINLTFQFFFVYIWIWAAITVKEFTGYEWALMTQTMENCKGVVMFCPMLSIL